MQSWSIGPGVSRLLAGLLLEGCAAHAPTTAPRAPASELRVASFNLYFPAAEDPETVEAVAETSADVIFLQEVTPRWEAVLRQRYEKDFPHMLFAARGAAGGLGALSRFPLEDAGFLPAVLKHPAWLLRVRAPSGDLHVLNVHLRASRRPGQNWLAGVLSIGEDHETEIQTYLQSCRVPPDIVLGDFNEGAAGPAIRWLVRQGYIDVLENHEPGAATWRAAGGLLSTTFDHILFRGCFQALDAWVVHSGNSDHWPVVARFETLPAAACR
ncbi:MAG TPA: endonuclease/exonuclease/phosphatase family protein [Polyangiaceae bacterium]|nr:endonuclease/exonuclease/phosphatase family protein [Polyangiaceae bacterium]